MTRFRFCSLCGRKCDKVFYFVEEPDRQLCSFCLDAKRRIWKAKVEDKKRGYSFHYCRNCGEKLSRKIFDKNGEYCDFCIQLKVRDDAIRNKLHEEALEHG
jgi:NMD protein affecting ribosome stability and mRNA decay